MDEVVDALLMQSTALGEGCPGAGCLRGPRCTPIEQEDAGCSVHVLCRFRGVRRKVPGASKGGLIWRREVEEDRRWQQHNKMSLDFSMKDMGGKKRLDMQWALNPDHKWLELCSGGFARVFNLEPLYKEPCEVLLWPDFISLGWFIVFIYFGIGRVIK